MRLKQLNGNRIATLGNDSMEQGGCFELDEITELVHKVIAIWFRGQGEWR
jgi:hypothetical protein